VLLGVEPDLSPTKKEMKMAYHWRNGWYWSRLPDGSVEVRNHGDFEKHDSNCGSGDGRVTLVIPPAEWASIVSSVSKGGESNGGYRAAVDFHGEEVKQLVECEHCGGTGIEPGGAGAGLPCQSCHGDGQAPAES
jgi:hypothetical protein